MPDGVTLDGDGKTITLTASVLRYDGSGVYAGILFQGGTGTVRNLTVDPRASCGDEHAVFGTMWAILFAGASGRVEDVTIAGPGTDPACHNGVRVAGSAGMTVDPVDVVFASDVLYPTAISDVGQVGGTVSGSEVQGAGHAVEVDAGANPTIEGNALEGATGVTVSGTGAAATVRNNTITGRGAESGNGVEFYDGGGGEVSGNAIANFLADGACGIRLAADAGTVQIEANTFPAPGNAQDICDLT